jgi:orotidine-5'-phosphate decarboxylase
MSPAQALTAGASQLVIGRPIIAAADPVAAWQACCSELSHVS